MPRSRLQSCDMKVVKVYGALREKLGQCRFEFHAETPAQAIKALCVNFPGLDKWFIDQEESGIAFRVTVGKEKATDNSHDCLVLPWSERDVFSIAPVIAGAGRGVGAIIAGVALVALSVVSFGAGTALAGVGAAGAWASNAAFSIGAGLLLTGIAEVVSPTPILGSNSGKDSVRLESFSFSNIANTTKQGLPVPIAYGRLFVGSAVVSSGLDVDQK